MNDFILPDLYGETSPLWQKNLEGRHPNSQYLTNHEMLSTQHAVATKQHSNKKRFEYKNVSIKTEKIPCFKSHVLLNHHRESLIPSQPKPPKQNLDLLQDDVCQSGSCLGIPKPQSHLRSCSSYSTHVCKLSWRFLHSLMAETWLTSKIG